MNSIKKTAAALTLCAIMLLCGCSKSPEEDPLSDYGQDATLPQIDREPTEIPATFVPNATATPPAPTWNELPLDDDSEPDVTVTPAVRPTRKPTPMAMDVQLSEFIRERMTSERDNTGTYQANVMSGGMAVEIADDEGDKYLYFTAADGNLYSQRRLDGIDVSWDIADAHYVSGDCAVGMIASLSGDLLYICGGDLVMLTLGDTTERTVLCSFDEITGLTRWDNTIYIAARDGEESGIYALYDGVTPREIVPGGNAVALDVVERRLLVLMDSGLYAYSLDGDLISPMVECEMNAVCYIGGDLYYSTGDAIYRLMSGGSVEKVLDEGASWLGSAEENLFYINSEDGMLYRAEADGSNARAISAGEAFNPTLLSDRIAYGVSPDGGMTNDEKY